MQPCSISIPKLWNFLGRISLPYYIKERLSHSKPSPSVFSYSIPIVILLRNSAQTIDVAMATLSDSEVSRSGGKLGM